MIFRKKKIANKLGNENILYWLQTRIVYENLDILYVSKSSLLQEVVQNPNTALIHEKKI